MKRIYDRLARWPPALLQLTNADAVLSIVSREPIRWDRSSSLYAFLNDDVQLLSPYAHPERYVKQCEISPSSPLTLMYWRALRSSLSDDYCRIDRIITAMYLPEDVSFALEYQKHTIFLRSDHRIDLSTLLAQSRNIPITCYSPIPMFPVPDSVLFEGGEAFEADGVTYRRRVPIYPFIHCTMAEQFAMYPTDPIGKCDVYIEYANVFSEKASSRMKGLGTIVTEEFDVVFNSGIIYDIKPDPVISNWLEYIYSNAMLMESIPCDIQ